jgi:fructokinase
MTHKNGENNRFRPGVVGMGLIALDVVIREGSMPQYFAGGTCSNVLTILAYLGWRAMPITRHAHDHASGIVTADLRKWGVDLSYMHVEPLTKTPIIVERLERDINGIPYHRFSFFCPSCNRRYAGFQPVPLKSFADILPEVSEGAVLFVDRVSPSSVAAAKMARENGAVIYFEPPSASDEKNFKALLSTATIVKYSHDRIDELEIPKGSVKLEIQTLGRGGLRFRTTLGDFRNHWHHLDAEPKKDLVDAAGAGDWLSAGIIHVLCKGGEEGFLKTKRQTLLRALSLGQSLAVWNCGFVGARGGMYGSRLQELGGLVKKYALESHDLVAKDRPVVERNDRGQICAGCDLSFENLNSKVFKSRAS